MFRGTETSGAPRMLLSLKRRTGEELKSFPRLLRTTDELSLEVHVVRHRGRKPALHIVHTPSIYRRVTVEVGYC